MCYSYFTVEYAHITFFVSPLDRNDSRNTFIRLYSVGQTSSRTMIWRLHLYMQRIGLLLFYTNFLHFPMWSFHQQPNVTKYLSLMLHGAGSEVWNFWNIFYTPWDPIWRVNILKKSVDSKTFRCVKTIQDEHTILGRYTQLISEEVACIRPKHECWR